MYRESLQPVSKVSAVPRRLSEVRPTAGLHRLRVSSIPVRPVGGSATCSAYAPRRFPRKSALSIDAPGN